MDIESKTQLTTTDLMKVMDLYFNEKFVLYKFQYDAFSQFIEETIFRELKENPNIIDIREDKIKHKIYIYKFEYDNIALQEPVDENGDIIFPETARTKHLTYASKLVADIKQIQETINFDTGIVEKKIIAEEKAYPITKIPIMVRSKYCSTYIYRDKENTECEFDPGCYFIVKGSEKVVLGLERLCENRVVVFARKEPTYKNEITHTALINSKQHDINSNIQVASIMFEKDDSIKLNTAHFKKIPLCIMFRALGIESDEEIMKLIAYDETDLTMIHIIMKSILDANNIEVMMDDGKNYKVKTQATAIQYIANELRNNKRYNNILLAGINIKNEQKMVQVYKLLANDFLPHMGIIKHDYQNTTIENYSTVFRGKAYYLGFMVNKLISCHLKRIEPDDKDSYVNKRIEVTGTLMGQLFRQYYRKLLLDCQKIFKKRIKDDANPINIINQIKSSTIEQGFVTALSIGVWGSNKKKGVAQMLQRLTYLFSLSYLRRITNAPYIDESNSKVVNIRHANNMQYGYIDVVETPDGGNVGIIKNLSLSANVTMYQDSQHDLVINMIKNAPDVNVMILAKIVPLHVKTMIKVFVNGNWIGLVSSLDAVKLVDYLRKQRAKAYIHNTVSIVLNYFKLEIHINSDAGRLYRPLLCIKDNKFILTKEMVNKIDLDGPKLGIDKKISKWNELLKEYPGVIENVDIEESEFSMMAMYVYDVNREYTKMNKILNSPNPFGNPVNRYDSESIYKKFTHCEIHPMLMLGVISGNIPFSEHNQSPRNYFNFAQARQGMGLFATNFRYRTDIAYLLYHPQKRLVATRAAKYTNTEHMPHGENVTVAVACYTATNQEDSIIINRKSIEEGMFNATAFKKYVTDLKKNSMTTEDDVFTKPDPNTTSGMKDYNYDKLNEYGYVEEETIIENGDVILGKVTPVQSNQQSNKRYIDDSEVYKSNVPGVVDKIFLDLVNTEGYPMRVVRVRSERRLMQGDKLCQLSTHDVLTDKGWINIKDLYYRAKNGEEFKVAQLTDNKYIEYIKPIGFYEIPYEGKMYRLTSQQVDMDVTICHKLYAKKRTHKDGIYDYFDYKLQEAKELVGKRYKLKKDCLNMYEDMNIIKINDTEYNMNAFLELLGIFIADGWVDKDAKITLAGTKPRKIKHINEVCNKLGLHVKQTKRIFTEDIKSNFGYSVVSNIHDNNLYSYFETLNVGAINKFLPEFVWKLSMRQSRILLESLISCDGHIDKKGVQMYYTSSKQLADDVMRLAIHAGWSGSIKTRIENGSEWKISNKLCVRIIRTKNEPEINQRQNGQKEEVYNYKGNVYCLEVPSHVFMTRLNGKNHWTGNSSSHG